MPSSPFDADTANKMISETKAENDRVVSLDVNPSIVLPQGCAAVDARIETVTL
jgi:hypothetical protein